MSEYLTRLKHFSFEKDGDELVVTSERDDSFERVFDVPDDVDVTDDEQLFERYYTELLSEYESEQS